MTGLQKTIAIGTLAFVAIFSHVLFCDWETGEFYRLIAANKKDTIVISIGSSAGVYARSPLSHAVDAVLGVAFPVTLFGVGLFILAAPHRNDQIHQSLQRVNAKN